MPRRLSPHDLGRFLTHLSRTGNVALAAARTGRGKSVFYKHRAADPAFAHRCEAALTLFRAHLFTRASPSPLAGEGDSREERERGERNGTALPSHAARPRTGQRPLRTLGGELHLHTSRARPPQLRRAVPGRLTPAGIAAFLRALSATANIRLAAQSVGVAPSSVHARRRRDPAFAKEWDEALELGCFHFEMALIERAANFMEGIETPAPAWEDDGLDPFADPDAPDHPGPAIAPVTVDDALRILTHHTHKRRRAQATHKPRPTVADLAPQLLRKAAAIRRLHGD